MSRPVHFSLVHGENIAIDKYSMKAKWASERSGGWLFSEMPLEAGQEIHVTLGGSGHCDVGVIQTDPKDCDILTVPALFKKLNGVQIHRKKCVIAVCLNREKTEVKSGFNNIKKKVDKKCAVWIAVYVKFGHVSVQLENDTTGNLHKFSENHGTNILLESSGYQAATLDSNPAALCFVNSKLQPGEIIHLVSKPLKEGDRKPSRFHLKLFVCHNNPDSFLRDFKSAFDTSVPPLSKPPLTVLEILNKEECDGNISIALDKTFRVRYVSASKKQNNQILNFDASTGVWVGFELYRASVELKSRSAQPSVPENGLDEVDSRVREPRNELAEDSVGPFNSFVNHLQKKQTNDPYLSQGKQPISNALEQSSDLSMLQWKHSQTRCNGGLEQINVSKQPTGYLMEMPNKTVIPPARLSHGQYVQRYQDTSKEFGVDLEQGACCISSKQTEPKIVRKQTVPKNAQIPKPIGIPVPNDLQEQNSGMSFGTTEKKNILLSSDIPQQLQASKNTSRLNTWRSLNDESAIVYHLSKIETQITNIAASLPVAQSEKSKHESSELVDGKMDQIQKNWVILVENICADKLCDHFYQDGFIRDDERQSITDLYKSDSQTANRQLLTLIKKRKIPLDSLMKIFEAAEHGHLVDILKK